MSGFRLLATLTCVLLGAAPLPAADPTHPDPKGAGRRPAEGQPGPAAAARVRVSEVTLPADMDCFQVETPTATYVYGKKGAGFARILDKDGHDWISYHPGDKARGEYRGLGRDQAQRPARLPPAGRRRRARAG